MKRSAILRKPDGHARLTVKLPEAKTCAHCQKDFAPDRPMQQVCSPRCANRKVKADKKAEVAAVRARKEALKSRSAWMREAQAAVNKYVRLRDIRAGFGCITCGARFESRVGGAFDAGHLHSRGSNPHLRFHLHNIALQCVKDNQYRGGMPIEFRAAMVKRLGIEKIEAMEAIKGPAKFSIEYLRRLKAVFTKKARRLEKRERPTFDDILNSF